IVERERRREGNAVRERGDTAEGPASQKIARGAGLHEAPAMSEGQFPRAAEGEAAPYVMVRQALLGAVEVRGILHLVVTGRAASVADREFAGRVERAAEGETGEVGKSAAEPLLEFRRDAVVRAGGPGRGAEDGRSREHGQRTPGWNRAGAWGRIVSR